jgi:hypothetical protein
VPGYSFVVGFCNMLMNFLVQSEGNISCPTQRKSAPENAYCSMDFTSPNVNSSTLVFLYGAYVVRLMHGINHGMCNESEVACI